MTARDVIVAGAVALVLGAGCGGAPPAPATPAGAAAPGDVELVPYRDGALVRARHRVELAGGRAVLTVPLPGDVEPGEIEARVIEGGATLRGLTIVTPGLRPGDAVEVRDGDRVVRGTLRWTDGRHVVLDGDDGGARLLLDPRHVVRREQAGSGATRRLDVALRGDGNATVELAYATETLAWRADYTLVLDPDVGTAELHGALGIDDAAAITYEAATITLVDTVRPTQLALDSDAEAGAARADVAEPTKPRAEQPPPVVTPRRTPRTTLPFPVRVAPGSQSVSLLAGRVRLPARRTLVYDPVGDDLNLSGERPTAARDYGLDRTSPALSQSIDIDLSGDPALGGMPTGTVRLLERAADGRLAPLGESRIFERTGTRSDGTGSDELAPTTTVPVGRSPDLVGKRIRREYSYDPEARRLTEEIVVELTSTADRPREVIVREHLYRGLTWTLAYHSAPVVKEGAQKIALTVTVPPRGTAKVAYVVVYHWD